MQIPFFGLDPLRLQALLLGELRRVQQCLLDAVLPRSAVAPTAVSRGAAAGATAGREELSVWLRRLQLLLLQYPLAAQAAFSALVAEGRRFATTSDGERYASALANSEAFSHVGPLWEALGGALLEEDPNAVWPSMYLDVLFMALRSPELERLIEHLRGPFGGENVPSR